MHSCLLHIQSIIHENRTPETKVSNYGIGRIIITTITVTNDRVSETKTVV